MAVFRYQPHTIIAPSALLAVIVSEARARSTGSAARAWPAAWRGPVRFARRYPARDTREEIERALDLGADGVMTDEVVLLRDILAERGQWHPRVAA
jgi:hypothetical protein